MTLVDRFICRREGHKPSVTLTRTSGLTITSYISTCLRCGKPITMPVPPDPPPGSSR